MGNYIATFFTHYDAILYQRALRKLRIIGQMRPVPRRLSSSCGTCVSFEAAEEQLAALPQQLPEQLVRVEQDGYGDVIDNR
ncbi:MAG: DUF3343 domain-containing protein [Clostridia bacterium]|nr:DUF3343 domain-containing protein [Clostridia bacterium]